LLEDEEKQLKAKEFIRNSKNMSIDTFTAWVNKNILDEDSSVTNETGRVASSTWF